MFGYPPVKFRHGQIGPCSQRPAADVPTLPRTPLFHVPPCPCCRGLRPASMPPSHCGRSLGGTAGRRWNGRKGIHSRGGEIFPTPPLPGRPIVLLWLPALPAPYPPRPSSPHSFPPLPGCYHLATAAAGHGVAAAGIKRVEFFFI